MALPTSVAGTAIAPQNSFYGPFDSSQGEQFLVLLDSVSQDTIELWKATDPTSAFSNVGVNLTPAAGNNVLSLNVVQDGDILHIAVQLTNNDVYYLAYDMFVLQWTQTGNGLAITGVGDTALAGLTSSRVAFIDGDNDKLRTYDFDGTDWSQTGNGLTVATVGNPDIATLTSSRVAFIDDSNDELRAYDFDGTDWTQVGNGLAIATIGVGPALAGLTSSRVAFIDGGNEELRAYDFDGTDWTQVGNSLTVTDAGFCALTSLTSNRVAFLDSTNDKLRTYDFDGTDWSQTGNGLAIADIGVPTLATLTSGRVALFDAFNSTLQAYDFDGMDWSQTGDGLSISGVGSRPALAALSSSRVAFIDDSNDELRAYDFSGQADTSLQPVSVDVITTTADTDPESCEIVIRSDGDLVIFYQGEEQAIMGTGYARLDWAVSTNNGGSWTLQGSLEASKDLEVDVTGPRAVIGDSDATHLVYRGNTGTTTVGNQLMAVAISSADVLQNFRNTGFDTASINYPIGHGIAFDRAGTTKIRFPFKDTNANLVSLEFDAAADPSAFTSSNIDTNEPKVTNGSVAACMANDGDVLHAMWVRVSDDNLYTANDEGTV